MGSYRFDFKNWPILLFVAEGDITLEQLEAHFKEHRAVLDRKAVYVMVLDGTAATSPDAYQRKRHAEFLTQNNAALKKYCKAWAFVVSSAVVRGALTALLWMAELPFPHKVFHSLDEAMAWAKLQMHGPDK